MGGRPVERRRRIARPAALLHVEGMVVRQPRAAAQVENAGERAWRQFCAHQGDDAAAGLPRDIDPPCVERLSFRTQPVLHVIDGPQAVNRLDQRQIIRDAVLVVMPALQIVHGDGDDVVAVAEIVACFEQHIESASPIMDEQHDSGMFIAACGGFADIHRHRPPFLQKLIVLPCEFTDVFFFVCHVKTPIRKGT